MNALGDVDGDGDADLLTFTYGNDTVRAPHRPGSIRRISPCDHVAAGACR